MFLNSNKIQNVLIKNNVFIKPEYLIHEYISGNKYRKLKYNLSDAQSKNFKTLLTFGGAYSNHIAATAAAEPPDEPPGT